jgi:hypothetical protein
MAFGVIVAEPSVACRLALVVLALRVCTDVQ